MAKTDNQQITKKDLIEILDVKFSDYNKKMDEKFTKNFADYDKKMDEKFTKNFADYDKKMDEKFTKNFADYDKKMDEKLGNFADDVLLPAIETIVDEKMDEKLGEFRIKERDYLNQQLFKVEGNLRSEIQEQRKTEHKFIQKFVKVAKYTDCFRPQDIAGLSSFANNLNIQKHAIKT